MLKWGNEALANLGLNEEVRDVTIFFSDQFYLRWFEVAFPTVDFSSLELAESKQEMVANVQVLISFMESHVLKRDLNIKGADIIKGNKTACNNFVKVIRDVSKNHIPQKKKGALHVRTATKTTRDSSLENDMNVQERFFDSKSNSEDGSDNESGRGRKLNRT